MPVVGTAFRTILSAMKAKIEALGLPDVGCYVAIRMNPPATDGRNALIIVPLYQNAISETQEGAGRCSTIKKSRVNIYYRHGTALDEEYRDDVWALADNGYFDIIDQLEDAFDLWHPVGDNGAHLLSEPARLVMDNEPRKRYEDHTWGEGMLELELQFRARRTV